MLTAAPGAAYPEIRFALQRPSAAPARSSPSVSTNDQARYLIAPTTSKGGPAAPGNDKLVSTCPRPTATRAVSPTAAARRSTSPTPATPRRTDAAPTRHSCTGARRFFCRPGPDGRRPPSRPWTFGNGYPVRPRRSGLRGVARGRPKVAKWATVTTAAGWPGLGAGRRLPPEAMSAGGTRSLAPRRCGTVTISIWARDGAGYRRRWRALGVKGRAVEHAERNASEAMQDGGGRAVAMVAGRAESVPVRTGPLSRCGASQVVHPRGRHGGVRGRACVAWSDRVVQIMLRGTSRRRVPIQVGPVLPRGDRIDTERFPTRRTSPPCFCFVPGCAGLIAGPTTSFWQTTAGSRASWRPRVQLEADSTLELLTIDEFAAGWPPRSSGPRLRPAGPRGRRSRWSVRVGALDEGRGVMGPSVSSEADPTAPVVDGTTVATRLWEPRT